MRLTTSLLTAFALLVTPLNLRASLPLQQLRVPGPGGKAPSVGGAPAIVQSNSGFSNGSTSLTVTLAANVGAGHMILVFVTGVSTQDGCTINAPTMTGETFTAWSGAASSVFNDGQAITYAVNSAAGGHNAVVMSVTGGACSGEDAHMHVVEISGQNGTNPRDTQGATHSTTLSVSTSGSTTNANDLILAFLYCNPANRTLTAGSGYSQVRQTNNTTGGDSAFSESKSTTGTGTQTATATGNSGSLVHQIVVTVKP
jgi:hypothetical protein